MIHASRRGLIAGFAVVVAFIPAMAYTYTLLSPTRHWASIPVPLCVVGPGHVSITAGDPDGGITATIQAINGTHPHLAGTGWNTTPIGTVATAQTCSTPWRLGDGVPSIAFNEMIPGTCSGSCLAATFVGSFHCNDPLHPDGHCLIDDADVEIRKNTTTKKGGPYYSLYELDCARGKEWNIEAIIVHEVGHQLGIGHTDVVGATMYPSVSSCNAAPATIEGDDIAALDALY